MLSLTITVPKGYDLLMSVHSWIYPDVQPVPEKTGPGWYGRVLTIDQIRCPTIVKQSQPGSRLRVSYSSDNLSAKEVTGKLRRVLGLHIETRRALDHILEDESISSIAAKVEGIRPYIADSPFEALVKSIVQQQISYRAANVVTKRMILGLSIPESVDQEEVYMFPGASALKHCGTDGLQGYGLGYRAEYVDTVCTLVDSGNLDLQSLVEMSYAEVLDILCAIRGVGEWTVQTFMIAGVGDLSVFPYGDLGTRNLLGRIYDAGRRMSTKGVIDKSQTWGQHGPMVLYLLMCADVLKLFEGAGRPKMHKR